MATVNDVLELAKALEGKAVVPIEARCVAVRNRNASCRRCIEVCSRGALSVKNNEFTIDNGACIACGACVAVCPTSALVALEPTDDELAQAVATAASNAEGEAAIIACARAATHGDGDSDLFAKVPCLGRVDELLLLELAARGISDIVLVDGGCESCKYGAVSFDVDDTLAEAERLLAVGGCEAKVSRASKFPAFARMEGERAKFGASRRSFLSNTSDMAKDAARIAAEQTIASKLKGNQAKKVATLRDKLGVSKEGRLPVFHPARNMRLLDAMYAMAEESGALDTLDAVGAVSAVGMPGAAGGCFETRNFGTVDIDVEKCTGCGMCTMFCPMGALSRSEETHPDENSLYLEFSAANCVQCGLCIDVCTQKAITLDAKVSLAELFDFEPKMLSVKKPAKKAPLFGRRR